jgi:hypothetical protein
MVKAYRIQVYRLPFHDFITVLFTKYTPSKAIRTPAKIKGVSISPNIIQPKKTATIGLM